VVAEDWLRFVKTPAATDGGYGGHFWLNLPRPAGREDALFPKAGPADAFGAVGHLGQYVVVVPSRQLVVVRLGHTPDARRGVLREALGVLVGGFAAASP
jgi:CubicO group peptidase (beta-lactamase class C family)